LTERVSVDAAAGWAGEGLTRWFEDDALPSR
jgi:hypothetical protein